MQTQEHQFNELDIRAVLLLKKSCRRKRYPNIC